MLGFSPSRVRAAWALASWALGASGPAFAADTSGAGIAWTKDFQAAERQGRAEARLLLVDFWADWCRWCHELDLTTYRDAAVVDVSRDFVAVKVNAEGGPGEAALAARYRVETLPTIAFITPGGRLFLRRTAYEGPEPFAATLREARRVGAQAIAFEAALARDTKDPGALAGLGALLAEQKLMPDARGLLARARKLDQMRPVAERKRTRRLLAAVEQARGKRSESLRLIEEALALQPPDAAEDAAAAEARLALGTR